MQTTPAYLVPEDPNEALEMVARNSTCAFLAGGTSRFLRDEKRDLTLIDLRKLGLDTLHCGQEGLQIGAATPLGRLLESDAVRGQAGGILASALESSGHPVLRNHATLGGRLLDTDVDDLLSPVLLVQDALVVSQTAPGAPPRTGALAQLDPHDTGLVLRIEVPQRSNWSFAVEALRQTEYDPPLVGVAVGLQVEGGRVVAARVAACGVGISGRRAGQTESALVATDWPAPTFESVQNVFQREIQARDDPRASRAFRTTVAVVLLARALLRVREGGTQGRSHAPAR